MRDVTSEQEVALAAYDRATFARISVEDPDGNMQDVGDLSDSDFLFAAEISSEVDHPISEGTFLFWRATGENSLAPLMEGSPLNVDSTESYAPFLNPVRRITVELATMLPGETPDETLDWALVWDGVIDEIDWGGPLIKIEARDRLAILNDTIIETVSTYGDDGGSKNIDDVMQDILDDVFGSNEWPLTVVGTPTLPIAEYELGNVSVMDALTELADLIGWSLHHKWDGSAGEFRLTFYEPDRSDTTSSWTFGPDDYYHVESVALGSAGVRNKGEVVYDDLAGEEHTVSDTRSTSVAIYGTRFIRIDARDSSIRTEAQANNLLTAVLDDLESPKALQSIEAALFWPVELGDVYTYEANDVHYDTAQKWAVVEYTHMIQPHRLRTQIKAAGHPSGGFARWHKRERETRRREEVEIPERGISARHLQSGSYDNLVRNPGFEQDAQKTDPWRAVNAQGTWSITSGDPRSGSRCLTFDPSGMTDDARIENGSAGDRWEASEGDRFYFAAHAEGSGTGPFNRAQIRIYFRQTDGTLISSSNSDGLSVTTSYQKIEVTGTAPAGTAQVGFELRVLNDGNAGIIKFDDCYARRMVEGPLVVGTLGADVVHTGKLQVDGIRYGPLHMDTTDRGTGSSTSEETLETITIPAGAMGTEGGVRLTAHFNMTGNTGAKLCRLRLDGTEIITFSFNSAGFAGRCWMDALIVNTGSASAQRTHATLLLEQTGGILIQTDTSAIDTSGEVDLTITAATLVSSDEVTLETSIAELIAPGA